MKLCLYNFSIKFDFVVLGEIEKIRGTWFYRLEECRLNLAGRANFCVIYTGYALFATRYSYNGDKQLVSMTKTSGRILASNGGKSMFNYTSRKKEEGICDADIEDLLIRSVHSDKNAIDFFEKNKSNEILFLKLLDIVGASESGDARMEGAYWISQFDNDLIKQYEERLLNFMDDDWDSVVIHIMMALSRIKSSKAFIKIINERIKPQTPWEIKALMNYIEIDGKDRK